MARRVFVFGAGASVTVGAPVMARFIDAADDLRHESGMGVSTAEFALFFDLLQNRLPLLYAKSVVDLTNIESIFGIVEMGSLVNRLPRTEPSEIPSVLHATRRVLTETIENTCEFESAGGTWRPPEDYLGVAAWVKQREFEKKPGSIALVTFNYDIALDFALDWSGVPFTYATDSTTTRDIPLLKLHGSLNWSTCDKCGAVRPVALDDIFKADRRDPRHNGEKRTIKTSYALAKVANHCPDASVNPDPAIVPPSWNKTQYQRSFRNVWRRAAQELSDAQEVYVVGYSLPYTDSFFRDLLALGLVGSTRLKRFEVVNLDGGVCQRFQQLLGPECEGRFFSNQNSFLNWVRANLGPTSPLA